MKTRKKVDFKSLLLKNLHKLQLSAGLKFLEMKGNDPQSLTDPLDRSSLESNQSVTLMIHERERMAMRDIQSALAKIAQGTFGVCEICGDNISEKRLMVSPSSRLCVACQERQEGNRKVQRLIAVQTL